MNQTLIIVFGLAFLILLISILQELHTIRKKIQKNEFDGWKIK